MGKIRLSDLPMEFPTEKQKEYATAISRVLEIDLPKEATKSAYSDYISKYSNLYKRIKQSYVGSSLEDFEI